MSASCEHCVLLGRGPCYELITHPEESYRRWRVVGSKNFVNEEALAHWKGGLLRQNKKSIKLTRVNKTHVLMTPCA